MIVIASSIKSWTVIQSSFGNVQSPQTLKVRLRIATWIDAASKSAFRMSTRFRGWISSATETYLQRSKCEQINENCFRLTWEYTMVCCAHNGKSGCALKKASTSREATWASWMSCVNQVMIHGKMAVDASRFDSWNKSCSSSSITFMRGKKTALIKLVNAFKSSRSASRKCTWHSRDKMSLVPCVFCMLYNKTPAISWSPW